MREENFKQGKRGFIFNVIFLFFTLLISLLILKFIKELRDFNKELKSSRNNYYKLLELTSDLIIMFNEKSQIIWANQNFIDLFNIDESQFGSFSVNELIVGHRSANTKLDTCIRRNNLVLTGLNRVLINNKSHKIEIQANILIDIKKEGKYIATAFCKDITSELEYKAQLNASERKYRHLFNFSPMPKWTLTVRNFQIEDYNPIALELFGDLEDMMNLSVKGFPYLNVENAHKYTTLPQRQRIITTESINFMVNSEEREFILKGEFFEDNKEWKFLIVAIDITEENSKKRLISTQNEKLLEIAWHQSHVVRSPLARLKGLIGVLQHPGTTNEDKLELLPNVELVAQEFDNIISEVVKKTTEIKG